MLKARKKKNCLFCLSNIFSFGALFFIWLAIIALLENLFFISLGLVFFSFLFDILDGWAARKYKTESDFGRFLDSQIDTLIHLFYPALVFYLYFKLKDPLSIFIVFIFLAAGIFRLVRFNLAGFIEKDKGLYYPGLPVFVNNFFILILLALNRILAQAFFRIISLGLIISISILMVQKFPFPKPKRLLFVFPLLFILAALMFYLGAEDIK